MLGWFPRPRGTRGRILMWCSLMLVGVVHDYGTHDPAYMKGANDA